MNSNPNYDTQKDEIEILSNILFEQIKIIKEEPFYEFEIVIIPDISETPKIKIIFSVTFNNDYPNSLPTFDIVDKTHHVSSNDISVLKNRITKYHTEESVGMPIIYQAYEMIKVIIIFCNQL